MSLQGLVSGSECAVPFNPLSQVLKHTEGDRSLQQDRVAGPSSSRLQHLPSTNVAQGSERDLALARQFFEGNASGPSAGPAFAVPRHLPQDLSGLMQQPGPAPMSMNAAWANAQQPQMQNPSQSGMIVTSKPMAGWADEFGGAMMPAPSAQETALQRPGFNEMSYMTPRFYGSNMPMSMYNNGFANFNPPNQVLDKGKGKAKDIDFEAAFAQITQSLSNTTIENETSPSEQEAARFAEFDDTADLAEAMERAASQSSATSGVTSNDFREVWEQLQNSDMPPPKEDLAKWEAEFNQLMSSQRSELDYDFGGDMQTAWESGIGDWEETAPKFDNDGLPILDAYVFEENKYLDPSSSTRSPLEDAKALIEQNGSLTEAALMLEAAIQKGELGNGGYEAWILLGEARSMDEREEAGMRALTEGVKRAEHAGANSEGKLSLAISYTNEGYERAAHTMLLRWLSARFPDHPISDETWKSLTASAWHSHELVTEAFLSLARQQHQQGHLDPDVQLGLGVLFYTNGQYERAKDCFEAALSVRPNDFTLWNRLGSSLSNGNRPEEALGAYREALQRRPTYTRAIYNVGVACLNIGAHQEAAEHFLSALAMQDSSEGNTSEQLWQTLRRTFLSMNRTDLADQAKMGTNLDVFRKEGFDF
ncbi:peroxisome targeting signal receptor [Panus rudis PR-1116 ss-1]|nr:peroxisome targeting signal receptor [Panus rudis PR-1116 ss-1]